MSDETGTIIGWDVPADDPYLSKWRSFAQVLKSTPKELICLKCLSVFDSYKDSDYKYIRCDVCLGFKIPPIPGCELGI